jgi:hypothetical protein
MQNLSTFVNPFNSLSSQEKEAGEYFKEQPNTVPGDNAKL